MTGPGDTRPQHAPIRGSYWLADGKLLAGGYPGSFKPGLTRLRLEDILNAGIRTFIDLTCEGEGLLPYEPLLTQLAREKHIEVAYRRFSIKDRGLPATALMQEVLRTIREEIAGGRPAYVHCWGGIGRTGTVAGCWLMENGYACDAALARIQELRQKTPDHYTRSPETDEQVAFVRNWSRV